MNYVKELVDDYGFSKWRLHKLVGVSWNTIHMWYREVFQPSVEHKQALERIYGEVKM